MIKQLSFVMFLVIIMVDLCSEEISRESRKTKEGKIVTSIIYRNEPDGKIKIDLFGESPYFSDQIIYYDNTNQLYYERFELYDFQYNNPKYPEGHSYHTIAFFSKDNPYEQTKVEIFSDEETIISTYYYRDNNSRNLDKRIEISKLDNSMDSIHEIFKDQDKSIKKINESIVYFINNQKIKSYIKYFPNENNKIDQTTWYFPKKDFEKEQKIQQILTTYSSNNKGFLSVEIVYNLDGWSLKSVVYDPKFTENGFTKILNFYKDDLLKRQIRYFEKTLYKGRVYSISQFFNDDGTTKSTQFFDKDDNEITQ